MDAGSKWGTFVKIGSSVTLSCGDWIRIGGVEFIIRFCGGGCSCSKRHAHHRLHSLRLLREHQVFSKVAHPLARLPRQSRSVQSQLHECGLETDLADNLLANSAECPGQSPMEADENACSSEDEADRDGPLQDELVLLLSSRRPRGWTTAFTRLCQRSAMRCAGPPPRPETGDIPLALDSSSSSCSPAGAQRRRVPTPSVTPVPIAPLELDYLRPKNG